MAGQEKGRKTLSRRSFLRAAGTASAASMASPPFIALLSTILEGQEQKAWAEGLGFQPRKFLSIIEGGSPARYMYSFLTPYSAAGFTPAPMVGTRFREVGGRYTEIEYATHARHGIQVPTPWTYDVPAPGGGYRPMADLLQNLLVLAGINSNPSHDTAGRWNYLFPGAKKSTPALSGDLSNAPIAGINLQATYYNYKSTASKTAVTPSLSGNWISSLLTPFNPPGTAKFKADKAAVRAAYDGIFAAMDRLAKEGHPGAGAIAQNRNAAQSLAESNFAALDQEWSQLLAKYQDLVARSIFDPAHPLPGLNDLPIGHGGSDQALLYQLDGNTNNNFSLHQAADVRDAIQSTTTIAGLAERFALTEYALRNDLTSSIAFGVGNLINLRNPPNGAVTGMSNDAHGTGLFPSQYFFTLRHRALYACLLELLTQLEAANKFDDCVVSVSGEFNRNPRLSMDGSDHGSSGKEHLIFCGALSGPVVLGNFRSDGRGCWGAGGVVSELGRQLSLVDYAVTLAHLLRVPPPFTQTPSLVTLGSSGLAPSIERSRWV